MAVRNPNESVGNVVIIVPTNAACNVGTRASGSGCSGPGCKLTSRLGCVLRPNATNPPTAVAT
eukprot:5774217-Prymnesium_polylepis.3